MPNYRLRQATRADDDFLYRLHGAALMSTIIAEADARNLPVRLRVLRIKSARRLYERLDFVITEEAETHLLMLRPQ
ncbi:MAG: hypothetical protein M3008_05720 [Chloroflexota bacterium]|nr:hypothetical protein [Chloroflexota bacterium]